VDDAAARSAPGVKLVWHVFNPPSGQGEAGAKAYVQGQAVADPRKPDWAAVCRLELPLVWIPHDGSWLGRPDCR